MMMRAQMYGSQGPIKFDTVRGEPRVGTEGNQALGSLPLPVYVHERREDM